jgi:hypothetical protein
MPQVRCRFRSCRAVRAAPAIGALLSLVIGASAPAAAQDNWCIQFSTDQGALRCGFATYQQCDAARQLAKGICVNSPYAGSAAPTSTRPKARRDR